MIPLQESDYFSRTYLEVTFSAIQTVENPTVLLPTFGSHKATVDGYSTVLAVCPKQSQNIFFVSVIFS